MLKQHGARAFGGVDRVKLPAVWFQVTQLSTVPKGSSPAFAFSRAPSHIFEIHIILLGAEK